ncbi:glutathione transferase GstA [Aliamphritea hakodatensis]|uniref:glutathione transferase GstA n=1 Tax=Aliamphritea hakodatensis TaxID=2895352 RepID=UPI0022FD84A5|nr:glutathione transferase GstA [Aliamphritea hakodatensis]
MKLFYKPGACSLASHIILREAGADFELEAVDTDSGRTASDHNYRDVNPKGYVPALQLASGEVLTEGAVVLQFIADRFAPGQLIPAPGTFERVRVQEFLNYIGSELHKAFGPFFSASATEADKENARASLDVKFAYLNEVLSDGRVYLQGGSFSVADAYLFVVSNWANFVGIDLQNWPLVAEFTARIAKRPAVQAALQAEGLV